MFKGKLQVAILRFCVFTAAVRRVFFLLLLAERVHERHGRRYGDGNYILFLPSSARKLVWGGAVMTTTSAYSKRVFYAGNRICTTTTTTVWSS